MPQVLPVKAVATVIPFGQGHSCRSVARSLVGGVEQFALLGQPAIAVAMDIIINFPMSNVSK